MTHLLVATRNAHKTAEIAAVLGGAFHCHSMKEFPGSPAVIEDAPDFAGNALKKASAIAHWLATPPHDARTPPDYVLADDSGLEVDALGGAPGIHSARFAALDTPGAPPAQNSADADNNAKLLRLLAGVPDAKRSARFRCVLALVPFHLQHKTQAPKLFSGVCEGRIALAPSGTGGFGYDPLFIPDGQNLSFADLGESLKNNLSHRARALSQLRAWFEGSLPSNRR